jgi:hypothetical protein
MHQKREIDVGFCKINSTKHRMKKLASEVAVNQVFVVINLLEQHQHQQNLLPGWWAKGMEFEWVSITPACIFYHIFPSKVQVYCMLLVGNN